MNRRYRAGEVTLGSPSLSPLILMTACFALGLFLGCLLASFFQESGDPHLFSYLDDYFLLLENGGEMESSLLATLWEVLRWPLFAGLMGTTLFGVVAVPVLIFLRGILLSYALSVLVCIYGGWRGSLLSLCIFGAPALCSVVSLFLIGWVVLHHHAHGRGSSHRGETDLQRLLSCLLALFALVAAGTFVQHWICPALLRQLVSVLL